MWQFAYQTLILRLAHCLTNKQKEIKTFGQNIEIDFFKNCISKYHFYSSLKNRFFANNKIGPVSKFCTSLMSVQLRLVSAQQYAYRQKSFIIFFFGLMREPHKIKCMLKTQSQSFTVNILFLFIHIRGTSKKTKATIQHFNFFLILQNIQIVFQEENNKIQEKKFQSCRQFTLTNDFFSFLSKSQISNRLDFKNTKVTKSEF